MLKKIRYYAGIILEKIRFYAYNNRLSRFIRQKVLNYIYKMNYLKFWFHLFVIAILFSIIDTILNPKWQILYCFVITFFITVYGSLVAIAFMKDFQEEGNNDHNLFVIAQKAFLIVTSIVLLFALLYKVLIYYGYGSISSYDSNELTIFKLIYFSAVTFFSLGYGDFSPEKQNMLLAIIEVAIAQLFILSFIAILIGHRKDLFGLPVPTSKQIKEGEDFLKRNKPPEINYDKLFDEIHDYNKDLMALRFLLESRINLILVQNDVPRNEYRSLSNSVKLLKQKELFNPKVIYVLIDIIHICNKAIHDNKISDEEYNHTMDFGKELLLMLDELLAKGYTKSK